MFRSWRFGMLLLVGLSSLTGCDSKPTTPASSNKMPEATTPNTPAQGGQPEGKKTPRFPTK